CCASWGLFSVCTRPAATPIPQVRFDTSAAARLLDSLGWRDTNGDGVRERGGQVLRFGLLIPKSSALRMRYAALIQDQLKRVGAQVDLDVADPQVMQPRMF